VNHSPVAVQAAQL